MLSAITAQFEGEHSHSIALSFILSCDSSNVLLNDWMNLRILCFPSLNFAVAYLKLDRKRKREKLVFDCLVILIIIHCSPLLNGTSSSSPVASSLLSYNSFSFFLSCSSSSLSMDHHILYPSVPYRFLLLNSSSANTVVCHNRFCCMEFQTTSRNHNYIIISTTPSTKTGELPP